jgi:uncharacterized Zn finger protein
MSGDGGRTCWGGRWAAALEPLIDRARLSQGRWHARTGRVVRLEVRPGLVVARLQGGNASPRTVAIRLTPLSEGAWERVLDGIAAEAAFGAQLLAGELPARIEEVFAAAGASLFPRPHGDLAFGCSCSDSRKGPCKHFAAAYLVLGQRLEAEPLLLFLLRGRAPAEVTAGLRARRATSPEETARPFWSAPEETVLPFWSAPEEGAGGGATEGPPASLPVEGLGDPPFWAEGDSWRAVMGAAHDAVAGYATALLRPPSGAPQRGPRRAAGRPQRPGT